MADEPAAWRSAVAEDLLLFARLHGVELDSETFDALVAADYPACLTLPSASETETQARQLLAGALGGDSALTLPLDDLAADYATLYLNVRFQTSPNESAWIDKEGLERQEAMFAVREWYKRYGLEAGDWRRRQDDNLSLQLQFLAHVLGQAQDNDALRPAAEFMDAHLLRWIERYAERVAKRAQTPFYAALGMLTACYLRGLRDRLVALAAAPYPPEPEPQRDPKAPAEEPLAYVPGIQPSW
ncbi:MAG: molecular chaperone TorD family protein [Zoogloeaceae bacterium]|jgi:TorA maturation chaperone TorD|nr:molecular chaperone TorD family protein [Zoogloeaceae bacterium]